MLRRASGAQLVGVTAALAAAYLLAGCGGGEAQDSETGTEPSALAPTTTEAPTTSEEPPPGVAPKPGVFLHWPFRAKHEPARFGFVVNKRARKLVTAVLDCTKRSGNTVTNHRFLAYDIPIRDGRFRVTFAQGPAIAEGTFVTSTKATGNLEMACGKDDTLRFDARFAAKAP